ncbi:hypothetical protein [Candidatus Uabimicrobium sp. HlEnr_7]|uniref:hypothetical protein n=1 Tax=Candidatus Uabimicrobium helgolandensis TaxID=3095367 RepID=UPI0035570E2C
MIISITRIIIITVLITTIIWFFKKDQMSKIHIFSKLLIFSILLSAAMGLEYILFQLRPVLIEAHNNKSILIDHYYGLNAAFIFAVSQIISVFYILQNNRAYLAWLIPAMVYLFSIGIFGSVVFDKTIMIFADTIRVILILILLVLHEKNTISGQDRSAT